eukprot:TRINITY_DN781944_c0_g1_i1.p1 TRINITY_DN781944_c0_g1~~TRINITY_DN781944_c0_g1_i1.p1  ORF type:complete len:162 (+),score=8.67 TRINITY_DN781944_c0_g1_i1:80-565(+)
MCKAGNCGNRCRICRAGPTKDNRLMTNFCNCVGSMGYAHKQCLEQWILSRKDCDVPFEQLMTCEVCLSQYKLKLPRWCTDIEWVNSIVFLLLCGAVLMGMIVEYIQQVGYAMYSMIGAIWCLYGWVLCSRKEDFDLDFITPPSSFNTITRERVNSAAIVFS